MITWITTLGWSPFAVINPIWANCKENEAMKVYSANNLLGKIEKDLTILRNIKLEEGVN